MSERIHTLTAHELRDCYAAGQLSPVEVAETIIQRMDEFDQTLNAFIAVNSDEAMQQARASAERWRNKAPLSKLDGVPVSIKDLVDMRGFATRCGSLTTSADAVSKVDSPVVARLREAGCILLGKTNTSEFGWKGITDSPLHGTTRNPWNLDRSPGGSSGGAGAALAAGIGPLAHGNDAGGSIRIPCSYCGLYGLKPTFGLVPHAPNESPYSTLASNGPMTYGVRDAARMLTILAKPDQRDWYAAPYRDIDFETGMENGVKGLRIAYSPKLGGAEPTAEVEQLVANAAKTFIDLGATVDQVGPVFDPLRPTFEEYWKAGFAYLLKSIPERQEKQIDPGLVALAHEGLHVDLDTFHEALVARARLGAHMAHFHQRYDLLISPTTPVTAPRADVTYHSEQFDRWKDAVPYTVPFNLTGQPAASIPVGLGRDGLPVGMQIVGPKYSESLILRASRAYEKVYPLAVSPLV